ncbi:MAG: polysaccharide deacetylase family protein [Bacilli bacterium]|nr:polysaccharide deacetylase family protein [Bacilli bacterium]
MKKVIIIFITIITILLLIFFYGFYKVNNHSNDGISVLAYHHFVSEEEKNKYYKDNYNVISVEQFDKQMKYLKDNGYKSITPDKIICYIDNKCEVDNKSFLITMDDGNISSYYKALPILEKYGFDSINFVISSRINETTHDWAENEFYFLGQDKIDEILKKHPSMIIGSHTDNMHDLVDGRNPIELKNYEEVINDLKLSRKLLNNTKYLAYPFGTKDEKYTKAAKEVGFDLAFTFKDNQKVKNTADKYLVPRIEIRADYTMNDFVAVINEKVTLKSYTKSIIKKIINKD